MLNKTQNGERKALIIFSPQKTPKNNYNLNKFCIINIRELHKAHNKNYCSIIQKIGSMLTGK